MATLSKPGGQVGKTTLISLPITKLAGFPSGLLAFCNNPHGDISSKNDLYKLISFKTLKLKVKQ